MPAIGGELQAQIYFCQIMRRILFLFFLTYIVSIHAQELSKEVRYALNYMKSGYLEYAVGELRKSSQFNDLSAQYFLAECYVHGLIVPKDLSEAFALYRRAAERGLPDAMLKLSLFYKNGIVVSQSDNKSLEWTKRYERRGGRNVLPNIVEAYNEGIKTPANYAINPHDATSDLISVNNTSVQSEESLQKAVTTILVTDMSQDNHQQDQTISTDYTIQSEIDKNIPLNENNNENTFAVIIANENYRRVEHVSYAKIDGEIFKTYCIRTLGIPERNIRYVADASLNDIKYNLNWLKQVMEAYAGEAKAIFYYAGHGIPDESEKSAYLLPIDGYGSDATTGYKIDRLYTLLGELPSRSTILLLDACFSGTKRDGGMLASARGVAIKVKKVAPKGNLLVFSAAQGDETAYPYKEQRHGMFTYYLLKKLQETKGETTLGELCDYVTSEVRKQSIVINGKMQTPSISSSITIGESWRNWKLK